MTSPEFFINMKSIPSKESRDYDAFFENELNKIRYGLTVNGVFISGWLYWHLNHWHINKDFQDEIDGSVIKKFKNPDLRDNEWIIAEHLYRAEQEKKGLMIFGSRRLGKSEFEASYIGRSATIYEGSENAITGGNWVDIDLITSKLDKGLLAVHPYFKFDRIADNFRREVALGYKAKKGGDRLEWSKIMVRNFEDGKNTEAAAGITAKSFILDESGKFQWLQCFNAAKPAFTSNFGWRCSPIVTGTSGMFVPNSDSQKVFENPAAYNFLAIEIPNEPKKYGLFLPGIKRLEGKVQTKFGNYAKNSLGIYVPEESELFSLPFWDTDEEKAQAAIEEDKKQAMESSESKDILKVKMYFPENIRDLFLTDDGNDFPVEAAKAHLEYLEMHGDGAEYVELFRDYDGKIVAKPAEDHIKPVDFPMRKDAAKDGPIVIYEYPDPKATPGLYIGGADPYNQSTSTTSPSLGTLYIFKRLFDVVGGTFQNRIVASYAARPRSMKKWHENVELLLEYYGAICMPENEGGTFIQYFDQKNKGHLLADGYSFLKEISPHTTIQNRNKGLPATTPVINFCMALMLEYCKDDEVQVGTREDGSPLMRMGITRIPDKALLKEIIAFNSTGNFDRIVAFRHVLAYDNYLIKYNPVVRMRQDEEEQSSDNQWNTKSPFVFRQMNPFGTFKKSR